MPASPWASSAQVDFMASRRLEFANHQRSKRLQEFWPIINRDFFVLWPDRLAEYESWTDKEKKSLLSTAHLSAEQWISTRKKGIYNWFNNHGLNKGRRAGKVKTVKIAMPQTALRLSTEAHLYSKRYYKTRVKHLVEAEIGDKKIKKAERLAIVNKHLTECLKNETPEIRNEIKQAREEERRAQELAKDCDKSIHNAIEELTIDQLLIAQSSLPDVIADFCEAMGQRSGWSFAVLAGGPDAGNEGEIAMVGCHTGQDKYGHTFRRAYSQYEMNVVTPFNQHLHQVYPKSVREKYKKSNTTVTNNTPIVSEKPVDPSAGVSGSASPVDVSLPSNPSAGVSGSASPVDVSSPSTSTPRDKLAPKNAALSLHENAASNSGVQVVDVNSMDAPASKESPSIDAAVSKESSGTAVVHTVANHPGKENIPPITSKPINAGATSDPINVGATRPLFHQQTFLGPSVAAAALHLPEYGQEGTYSSVLFDTNTYLPAPYNVYNNSFGNNDFAHSNLQLPAPGSFTSMLAEAMGGVDNGFGAGISPNRAYDQWMMQNFGMRGAGQEPAFNWQADPGIQQNGVPSETGSALTAPSHVNSMPIPPSLMAPMPQHASIQQPPIQQPLFTPPMPQHAPMQEHTTVQQPPVVPPQNAPVPMPQHVPMPEHMPVQQPPVVLPQNATIQQPPAAPMPNPPTPAINDSVNDPVVSEDPATKNCDVSSRQQKPAMSKEIIPLIDQMTKTTKEPPWYTEAREYLHSGLTTACWVDLVEVWMQFEVKNGLFDPGSGSLRLPAKGRPAQLSKWMLDCRAYSQIPEIQDAKSFGKEWTNWWNSIQPKWRQAAKPGMLPVALSMQKAGDSLATLKKAGPVGIVMVIVSLKWWAGGGKGKDWVAAVTDVKGVLDFLLNGGGKRKAETEETGSKRRRTK